MIIATRARSTSPLAVRSTFCLNTAMREGGEGKGKLDKERKARSREGGGGTGDSGDKRGEADGTAEEDKS